VEVEDAAEHVGLAGVEVAADRRLGDDRLHVVGGVALLEVGAADPEQAQDRVRDRGEPERERRRSDPEPAEQPRNAPRGPLGATDREDLRHLLADGDVERGREREGDRERERGRDPVREPAREQRLDQVRERGLAEEPDPDRGHRDPDLAGREVLVDVVELPQHPIRAAAPLGGELLELAPAAADEGELGGDEEAVERDENEQRD
jgi:hypothetical protein